MKPEKMNSDNYNENKAELQEVQCTRIAFQNFGKLAEMENTNSTGRRWEDLEIDVLVKIFQSFNIIELTSGISRVCSSWRLAACDPSLWKTIDLGIMRSNYIQIPTSPYVWVDDRSDKKLMQVLKIALGLSGGNVSCLIFHLDLYLKDEHLIYVAERSPRLKRLVIPAWNRITKSGICEAVRRWEELESLTMPCIKDPPYIMEVISRSCKNFTQLKIMGPFDILFADTIAKFLPNLKVLSLRCSMVHEEALILLLDSMKHLEVLNLSHCLLADDNAHPELRSLVREIDESILEKTLQLQKFFTCQDASCIICQHMETDEGLLRWYKYEEGLWSKDEVSSLAH